MNILIVTQSSEAGVNHRIAKLCQTYARGNANRVSHVKIINASDVTEKDIRDNPYQIWIVPEWNGSFPFVFKKLIDDSGYPSSFEGVEVLLIGTSESTFGNLLGVTHLEHILQWCGAHVFDKRVCIPFAKDAIESLSILSNDRLKDAILKFVC
jgi:NAD(P)H-dependent FMN reductase